MDSNSNKDLVDKSEEFESLSAFVPSKCQSQIID